MPKIRLNNETGKVLGVWVEPLGEDFWMNPEDRFTLATVTPESEDSDEAPFEVVFHDSGVSVCVNVGYEAVVHDRSGARVDCGHQRPVEIRQRWAEAAERAQERPPAP
ncbi:hypothetical protein ACIQ9E_10240 [Streptomyces sp. NPDC094448]|uniref:hypothetical protein n=1 Tax=Streptomyces sp. NPDC094448 TaxID=3366063 RepID=UPI0038171B55